MCVQRRLRKTKTSFCVSRDFKFLLIVFFTSSSCEVLERYQCFSKIRLSESCNFNKKKCIVVTSKQSVLINPQFQLSYSFKVSAISDFMETAFCMLQSALIFILRKLEAISKSILSIGHRWTIGSLCFAIMKYSEYSICSMKFCEKILICIDNDNFHPKKTRKT